MLSLRGVVKAFSGFKALGGVSLEVEQGEFLALLGPSGCGKTTLLRVIAGFAQPEAGSVWIDGVDVTSHPPYRRPLNTVFQNYALFPHLDVLGNVAFGPRRKGVAPAEACEQAREALAMVGLQDFASRMPQQLSGGQQQRVALARALVNRPRLLLLDEPLSALDLKLRRQMQQELKRLQERLGIAFVFVTHDQEEAMAMADRIVVMNAGHVEQVGTGDEIYRRPASRFVADFIGEATLVESVADAQGRARLGSTGLEAMCPGCRPGPGTAVLRPEHLRVDPVGGAGGQGGEVSPNGAVAGVVDSVAAMGSHVAVTVTVRGVQLSARCEGVLEPWMHVGAMVWVSLAAQPVHLIAGDVPARVPG